MGAGTRQISLLVNGVFFTSEFLHVFSHMMGTLRTSTTAVVLAALLAAVIEFCLVFFVCGPLLMWLLFVFGPSVFPLPSLMLWSFSCFTSCYVFGRRRKDAVPFRCCRLSTFVPFVLCVLSVEYLYFEVRSLRVLLLLHRKYIALRCTGFNPPSLEDMKRRKTRKTPQHKGIPRSRFLLECL